MVNEIYGRIWKIDTPGADILHPGPFSVRSVDWVAPVASAGHAAVIQDANGKILWEKRANGANFNPHDRLDTWWNSGWKVPTLDSGTLYVTVG